jgi:uridine kinase
MPKLTQIVKRTGAIVPFNRDRITNAIYRAAVAVGGRDRAVAEQLSDQVVAFLEAKAPEGHVPTVEEIQDAVEKVLIEAGHARTAKAYILYREERARARQERARYSAEAGQNIPWRKIWEVLDWTAAHNLHTVERLNERIARGEFPQIVRETDRCYNEDISTAAEMVYDRRGEVRLVLITGPSSSGKTTTTTKLCHILTQRGLKLVPLTVDNYFFDLGVHPRDEFGDYDFETPQALDLALINEHLRRLLAGEEVRVPFYDFKTGRRHDEQTPLRIGPRDLVLIDSLHGLYPAMTADIDELCKFNLYLEPLLQMRGPGGRYVRWTDLRLMRRMSRDAVYRAYRPEQTLLHWHYVRKSELRHIIPYIHTADYIVNSGLPYELPVMCARMLESFQQWAAAYRGDPLREDALQRAERVRNLLEAVTPVTDESPIPPDSLLREFVGGSCYTY